MTMTMRMMTTMMTTVIMSDRRDVIVRDHVKTLLICNARSECELCEYLISRLVALRTITAEESHRRGERRASHRASHGAAHIGRVVEAAALALAHRDMLT